MKSRWSRKQIRAARQTPLRPVIEGLGYRLKPRRDGNYETIGLANEVIVKDHYWVSTGDGMAGNAIDFLVNVEGMTFAKAMELLAS